MSVAVAPYYSSLTKRLFDVGLALVLAVITSPLWILIAGLLFITVGRPIIFCQPRMGQYKKTFYMLKFRTMYLGAEKDRQKYLKLNEAPAPMFKISYDPRFVGVGQWLSFSGLDELPQLWNIIKGDMSFVGPRPLPVKEAGKLPKSWDFRYQVRPGIFSAWSLSDGKYDSLARWQRLDTRTVSRGSVMSDLTLIWQNLAQHLKLVVT